MPQSAYPSGPSAALLGYGARFLMASGSSPDQYVDFGEVFDITPPSFTSDQVDVTHMQSPDRIREFIDGLVDAGECSFEMNYIPGSASDNVLIAILALAVGVSRRRNLRIIYPNGKLDSFQGNLQSYEPTVPTDDKMTATVTFKVTGRVTRQSLTDSPAP